MESKQQEQNALQAGLCACPKDTGYEKIIFDFGKDMR